MSEIDIRLDHNITSLTAGSIVTIRDIMGTHLLPNPTHDSNATNGEGVTMLWMDSGIDDSHPVFGNVTVEHHNFTSANDTPRDLSGHGTWTSSIAVQIAPGIDKLIDLRVFGDSGSGGLKPFVNAYDWATTYKKQHPDENVVCNLSWGTNKKIDALDKEHGEMVDNGVVDSVAAGNNGSEAGSPGTFNDAFASGAMTMDKKMTRFSSFNPGDVENPDVVTLGRNVVGARAGGASIGKPVESTNLPATYRAIGGEWVKSSGTSISAPITTGAIALYLDQADELVNRKDVIRAFEQSAKDIIGTQRDVHGYVRYENAVDGDSQRKIVNATVWDVPFTGGEDVIYYPANWTTGKESYKAVKNDNPNDDTVVEIQRR